MSTVKSQSDKKEYPFDLEEDNVYTLGPIISYCVKHSVDLICYSSEAMKHPGVSLTQIPGLSRLFIRACLQEGLLGYLDWKAKNNPSEQNRIIRNNVIIITCGKPITSTDDNKDLAHEVDNDKLSFLTTMSQIKFEQLINV